MAGLLEKLRSLGIGVESPEYQERKKDPVVFKMMQRQIPTPEDFRISREYRARKARERELARTKPRDDGVINTTGMYTEPTAATSYSAGLMSAGGPSESMYAGNIDPNARYVGAPAATSYSAMPESAGGAINRGMYNRGAGFQPGFQGSMIDPAFGTSDWERITAAGGERSPVNPENIYVTDPITGIQYVVDTLGRTYEKDKFVEYDPATALITGTSGASRDNGSFTDYIVGGLSGLFSGFGPKTPEQQARADAQKAQQEAIDERNYVADLLVKQGRIDRNQVGNPFAQELIDRTVAERKVQREQAMESLTPQLQSLDATERQRMLNAAETAQMMRQQTQRDEALRIAADAGYTDAEAELETQRLLNRFPAPTETTVDALPPEVVSPPAIEVIQATQPSIIDEPDIARAVGTIGFVGGEWEAYKQGIADIESSGGNYRAVRGQHLGKYQMSDAARSDAAQTLGIKNPTREEFLSNPELQERMFAEYTRRNYLYLMKNSDQFKNMSPRERKIVLARAQLGSGNLRKALAGGPDKVDELGTRSQEFADSVANRFAQMMNERSRSPVRVRQDPNMRGGFEGTGEF